MRSPLSLLVAAALILGGCMATSSSTSANLFNRGVTALNAQRTPTLPAIEQQVSQQNIETFVGALTGQRPMPDGRRIPERGTTEGRNLTREYISKTLTGFGYDVELHNYRSTGTNVFTRLMAHTPTDEYILVGAHMDSVRNAGADDNSSGSSVVLETARVMKQLEGRKVNVIFAWFDEEEIGLIGSRAMARDFKKQGLRVTSVHTVDMLGWDSNGNNAIEIEQPDSYLWDYYLMVNEKHNLKLPLKRTSSGDTDHVAFRNEGYVAVGLCEEWVGGDTTPHYHRRTDTFDNIHLAYMTNGTRLLSAVISDMARQVPKPLITQIVPHHHFPARAREFHSAY
jgi:hypothetical protein